MTDPTTQPLEAGCIGPRTASLVFDVLVTDCEASEHDRAAFVQYVTEERSGEFCFDRMGGGKFYFNRHEWRVGWYRETVQRRKCLDDVRRVVRTKLDDLRRLNAEDIR